MVVPAVPPLLDCCAILPHTDVDVIRVARKNSSQAAWVPQDPALQYTSVLVYRNASQESNPLQHGKQCTTLR